MPSFPVNTRQLKLQIGSALVAVVLLSSAAVGAANVALSAGQLAGVTDDNGVSSFKGIPYAAPPVGTRRWRPPTTPQPWRGVRDAQQFGNACMQLPYESFSPAFRQPEPMSEDCLFLNIWTPELIPTAPLPVLVWIHGGAFTRGSGSNPIYDGAHLASKGIVVVTLNYRLNVFGYLAHPQLSEQQLGSSGNYGLLDQFAALRWINQNIAYFGGDPRRVTIAGESAGSAAVNQILASPRSQNLVHGAIGQSGGYLSPQAELTAGHEVGKLLMASSGVNTIKALRALPAQKLLELSAQLEAQGKRIRPLVDGRIIPEQPLALFKRGAYTAVPSLVGYNRDEASSFALYPSIPLLYDSQPAFESGLKGVYGKAAYPLIWAYPEREGSKQSYRDFWRDMIFGWNMQTWARLNEQAGKPSWLYLYSHVPGTELGERLGAYHSAENVYIFGNNVPDTPDDQRVAQLMGDYWVNFVRSGDPNGPELPKWPRHHNDGRYLEINATPQADEDLNWVRMFLWGLTYDRFAPEKTTAN